MSREPSYTQESKKCTGARKAIRFVIGKLARKGEGGGGVSGGARRGGGGGRRSMREGGAEEKMGFSKNMHQPDTSDCAKMLLANMAV